MIERTAQTGNRLGADGVPGRHERQNVVIEARWRDGEDERLASLAADLVRQNVDVIVTQGA